MNLFSGTEVSSSTDFTSWKSLIFKMGPLSQGAGRWGRSRPRGKPSRQASDPVAPAVFQVIPPLQFHQDYFVTKFPQRTKILKHHWIQSSLGSLLLLHLVIERLLCGQHKAGGRARLAVPQQAWQCPTRPSCAAKGNVPIAEAEMEWKAIRSDGKVFVQGW